MHLRLEESGEEDIHLWVIFGFEGRGRFGRGEGDLFVVFSESIGIHPATMHDPSIKEPRYS